MTERKLLPTVLRMRAERILGKAISEAFSVEGHPNLALCYLRSDTSKFEYVDFSMKQKVDAAVLQISVIDVPITKSPDKFIEDTPAPVFKSKINKELDEKEVKKTTTKKTTKKTSK